MSKMTKVYLVENWSLCFTNNDLVQNLYRAPEAQDLSIQGECPDRAEELKQSGQAIGTNSRFVSSPIAKVNGRVITTMSGTLSWES